MKKSTFFIALLSAPLILAGCSSTDSDTSAASTTTVTNQTPTATTLSSSTTAPAVVEDDPVFDIIGIVLAEYPDGIITDIDREDSSSRYEVDVVVGNQVLELNVTTDGQIHIDDRENDDDDDIREARTATVTAVQAIEQALDQFPDGVIDSVELDEDDGQLRWEVDLDDTFGNDLAEVNIPAV